MGIFADFKKQKEVAQQQYRERAAKLPLALNVEYYGGYQDYEKKTKGKLFISQLNVVYMGGGNKFEIAKTDLKEIAVEGEEDVSRRVTVTRLLAVGIFAFALKKKQEIRDAYITLVTNGGSEVVFHVPDKSHIELKPKVLQKIGILSAVTSEQNISSAADELAKLAKLKEQGVLTQEEFDKKKAQLLS